MKTIVRIFLFSVGAAPISFWPACAGAASPAACAALAQRMALSASVAAPPGVGPPRMVQQRLYARCVASGKTSTGSGATPKGNFVTFDVGVSPNPTGINPAGEIAGYYFDNNDFIHSFLRTRDGAITTFDPPGAACSAQTTNLWSVSVGLTPDGTIAGDYTDVSGASPSFLRAADGAFTQFEAPGSNFTGASAINPAGTITGFYFTAGGASLDFLRSRSGAFSSFAVPGGNNCVFGPVAINPAGAVTGFYCPAGGGQHGYVRDPAGGFTTFDPTGSVFTQPAAINPNGAITGYYQDAGGAIHGFLRAPNGAVTTFDAPGQNYGTFPTGITPSGTIVGYNALADGSAQHGFLRSPSGSFMSFDPPGSSYTQPTAISTNGEITGYFFTANFAAVHGFVGVP